MAASYPEATSEQTVLKPNPMSRKVLAFAGAAAFVLGNRSRVEILDLRDARMLVCVFSDTRTNPLRHRRARRHCHARRAGARRPRFHGQEAPTRLYQARWASP